MYKYIYSIIHKYYVGKGEGDFSKMYAVGLLTISNSPIFMLLFNLLSIYETIYGNKFHLKIFYLFVLLFNYTYFIILNKLDKNYYKIIEEFELKHKKTHYYFWGYFVFCIICFIVAVVT